MQLLHAMRFDDTSDVGVSTGGLTTERPFQKGFHFGTFHSSVRVPVSLTRGLSQRQSGRRACIGGDDKQQSSPGDT